MLIILNDPAGITGRRCIPFDFRATLQQNIERSIDGGADTELRINGVVVDPLSDARMDVPPGRDDQVVLVLRPRGGDLLSTLTFGILGAPLIAALKPNMPGQEAAGKDSPNNKLTGQSNVARTYQAIPDVYGYRRVWPDLIQTSIVEYIDQLKYVTEWLCVSRGAGAISQVRYSDTPIEDIDGSNFEVFEPTPLDGYYEGGQTTLSDVYETFASDEVNGQELPYAVPFVVLTKAGSFNAVATETTFTVTVLDGADLDDLKSLSPSGTASVSFDYGGGPTTFSETCTVLGFSVSAPNCTFTFSSTAWAGNESGSTTFTITPNGSDKTLVGPFTMPAEGDQLWWNTIFLRGLRGTVAVQAEWWKIDSGGVEVSGSRQSQSFSFAADTYDQRFHTTKVTPAAGLGRYRVQFQRTTAKVDDAGADVAKLEEVYAVRHYPIKVLPGVTVMRVTTKATLSATGFSDRKFNLRWFRKVRQLTSNGLSESRNFARIMAHIWTLSGNDIAGLDIAKLQSINAELGEDSTLLRFDGSLDDVDMSLGARLQFVADTARCVVWRDGTKWTVTRDQAKPFWELQFDYRNLAARGESTIAYSSTLPASNDGVEVEYVDESTQSKKAYSRLNISTGLPIPGSARNPKKVKMLGCATQAQADNRAQLEARRLLFQRVSVNDTALSDGSTIGLGAMVRWVDPNDFGGDDLQAGEVMSIAGDVLTTSEPLEWGGVTTGRIAFTGADGKRLGPAVECYQVAGGVQLASVPAGLYVADATRQLGSRYAFAVGLTQNEIEAAGLFLTTSVRPAADGTVSLAFASYDARIYQGDAA